GQTAIHHRVGLDGITFRIPGVVGSVPTFDNHKSVDPFLRRTIPRRRVHVPEHLVAVRHPTGRGRLPPLRTLAFDHEYKVDRLQIGVRLRRTFEDIPLRSYNRVSQEAQRQVDGGRVARDQLLAIVTSRLARAQPAFPAFQVLNKPSEQLRMRTKPPLMFTPPGGMVGYKPRVRGDLSGSTARTQPHQAYEPTTTDT